jgi:hypothetical protein
VFSSATDVPSPACGGLSGAVDARARQLGVSLPTVAASFHHGILKSCGRCSPTLAPRIEIASRSLEIHLPAPERFVQLTVLGALLGTRFCALRRVGALDPSHDDNLAFPTSAHIAVAYASTVFR